MARPSARKPAANWLEPPALLRKNPIMSEQETETPARAPRDQLAVVIVAAGSSRRMGFDKILTNLAGMPVFLHSTRTFCGMPEVGAVTLVANPSRRKQLRKLVEGLQWQVAPQVVAGGEHRWESVRNGLTALPDTVEWVAVHDGARPHITPRAILECWALARRHGCAACAAPVTDTLKQSSAEEGDPVITGDVNRDHLWAMQTPQIARREELLVALDHAAEHGIPVTDETSALRALDKPVALSANPDWNPKITYPRDLRLSEAWIELHSRDLSETSANA